MAAQESVVAIDLGSKYLRAGFAIQYPGEDEPRVLQPNLVEVLAGGNAQPATAPSTAPSISGNQPIVLHSPIQGGRVASYNELEALLHSVLYGQLGWVLGEEGSVVIAEPILTPKDDREKLTQLMFEVFNVNGLFIQDQPVCSLFTLGKAQGLVVDVGHGKVDITTVSDGLANTSSAARMPYGGEALTRYLHHLLDARGVKLGSLHDVEVLKEACTRCASSGADFRVNHSSASKVLQRQAAQILAKPDAIAPEGSDEASQLAALSADPNFFTLPDGSSIRVLNEGHAVAEALFSPELLGFNGTLGLAEAVYTVAAEQDGLRKGPSLAYSLGNVLLCGGGALLPGIGTRLQSELSQLAPGVSCALAPLPEYMPPTHALKHSAWMGAAMLGTFMGANPGHFIGKADYDEIGPWGVHRR